MRKTQKESNLLITYDLETTRIKSGTPSVLYMTAYGDPHYDCTVYKVRGNYKLSIPVIGKNKKKVFCQILEQHLLIEQNNGARFVAWNGNKFDVYFIAESLLESDRWTLQPYLTANKSLRGLRVTEIRTDEMPYRHKLLHFEFLDGMAMTGISCKLEKFLKTFAPEYQKLNSPNFDAGEEFNCKNHQHIEYAERDSEGLYHAMKKVSEIIYTLTQQDLKPTVGNLAIRHLMNNIPDGVKIKRPADEILDILYGPLKKGGYCWASKQYHGPVWKYDLNQAYAGAMRDAALPCGDIVHTTAYENDNPGIYLALISRKHKTKVPFYYKDEKNIGKFTTGTATTCWLTSIEIQHLKKDEWEIEIIKGYWWTDSFNLKNLVDKLEKLRATDKDGPSGPLGTMVKALGNNAYGKTLEQIWGDEFVFSKKKPDGYALYDSFDPSMKYIYARERESIPKKYHVPQIGVFVTADVRCTVRDAANYMPDNFLYADTDCVGFDKKAHHLHLDPTRYGSWKVESAGDEHIIIGKKVNWKENGGATAKGLIVKNLTKQDMLDWLAGKLPVQVQTQRQNILKFLGGRDMFRSQERKGTDVSKLKNVKVLHGEFIPR